MSRYHRKHHRSRSPVKNRESRSNQNRSKDYDRRADSYERHHHSMQSNRQQDYRYPSDLNISLDEILSNMEKNSPVVQTLIRELLLERQGRQLIEGKLVRCEQDYALLHTRHEQTINNMTILKHDYDQCRLDLKAKSIESNELRHNNHLLRAQIDQLLNNERQQTYTTEEIIYSKRQRRQ